MVVLRSGWPPVVTTARRDRAVADRADPAETEHGGEGHDKKQLIAARKLRAAPIRRRRHGGRRGPLVDPVNEELAHGEAAATHTDAPPTQKRTGVEFPRERNDGQVVDPIRAVRVARQRRIGTDGVRGENEPREPGHRERYERARRGDQVRDRRHAKGRCVSKVVSGSVGRAV